MADINADAIRLNKLLRDFQSSKNPILAISAFVFARESGLPVPEGVLAWLYECFRDWIELNGGKPLDTIMELNAASKGATLPIKKVRLADRNRIACTHAAELVSMGWSLESAAFAIEKLSEKLGLERVGAATIEKEFKRGKYREWADFLSKSGAEMDLSWISEIPVEAMPAELSKSNPKNKP